MSRLAKGLALPSLLTIFVVLALFAGNSIVRQCAEILFCFAVAGSAIVFSRRIGVKSKNVVIVMAVFAIGMVGLWLIVPDIRFAPYLAVVLANGLLTYMFVRGQLPGRTPLILQLIEFIGIGPVVSERFQRFIYWQCWAWVAFGAATSGAALMAMLLPNLRTMSATMITTLVSCQIGWFIISHFYAGWRYKRCETWLDTIKVMLRPESWRQINL